MGEAKSTLQQISDLLDDRKEIEIAYSRVAGWNSTASHLLSELAAIDEELILLGHQDG